MVTGADADIEQLDTIDSTRRFFSVRASGGEPLGGDTGHARAAICTALAAELTGVAQRAMEMAEENAELIRDAFRAFEKRDEAALLAHLDPEVEWEPMAFLTGRPDGATAARLPKFV